MKRIVLFLFVLFQTVVLAQTSEKYNSDYENFYRAEELFEKEQYAAARREFRVFMDKFPNTTDPMYIKASYYEAISALELFNNDAITLLKNFNRNYPESIYKNQIYFKLGRYFYYKKKYDEVLVWFGKLDANDVEMADKDEYYFKKGYSNFKLKNFDVARTSFYEVKDGDSQYAYPALYYYSHIAYQNKQYPVALEGFLTLENDPKFGKVVGYYIAQIYYLQGEYEKVTNYAQKLKESGSIVNEKDLNHLIGDAYYRIGKYDEAIPFLEKHNRSSETSREEEYRLGYAYFKTGACKKATQTLNRVTKIKDSLGQIAYYQMGDCFSQLNEKAPARSAFQSASEIDADDKIKEDALYNFAVLSYELDLNPYNEAVKAFELFLSEYPNSDRKEDVFQYLVNVYMSTNNHEKALASMDKVANKNIRMKKAYQIVAFNQGVDRFQKNDFNKAIQSFDLARKYPVDPAITGKAVFWKADAYFQLKNYDYAATEFKKFLGMPSTELDELKAIAEYNIGYARLEEEKLSLSAEAFRNFVNNPQAKKQRKADANMRIADIYFATKKNELAINFYQKVLEQDEFFVDQALFYQALTYGYSGESGKKNSNLLNIINNYRSSKYLQRSIYELARSYKSIGNFQKAKKYYNQIIVDYPNSNQVFFAKQEIAHLYALEKNYTKAEKSYLDLLSEYGSDPTNCRDIASSLKDLYESTNQQEKLEQLAVNYNCIDLNPEERENIYYLPAIQTYTDDEVAERQRYEESIPKFEKYLKKFPEGRYATEVKYHLGDCYYFLDDKVKAIEYYQDALSAPNNAYTEQAAARTAQYLFNNKQYAESIPYYERLEKISSAPEIVDNSKLGLMRANFIVNNYAKAAVYSDKVLAGKPTKEMKKVAKYINAVSYYKQTDYQKATPNLQWYLKNVTSERGAECHYYYADMLFQTNQFDEADKEITKLMKRRPAYNYYIGKGLLLRATMYMVQDKLVEAEQNLKSIIDYYENENDGIKDEANELWSELQQLKDKEKNIEPDVQPIIDLNGE